MHMPLKSCGSNGWGQLGLADTKDASTFAGVQLPLPGTVLDLASGSSHTLVLFRTTVPSTTAVHAEAAAIADAHKPPKPSPLVQSSSDDDDSDNEGDSDASVRGSAAPSASSAPTSPTSPTAAQAPNLSALLVPSSDPDVPNRSRSSSLVSQKDKPLKEGRNVLLASGTNTHGQLGPNSVLFDEEQQWTQFHELDLLTPLRQTLRLDPEKWHPVKIACTWSTSFVVYEKVPPCTLSAEANASGTPSSSSGSAPAATSAPATTAAPNGSAPSDAATAAESSKAANYDSDDEPEPDHVLVVVGSNDFGERANAPAFGGEVNIIQPGEKITHLAASQRHVVAVLSGPKGQRVVGWGGARHGQLGHDLTPPPLPARSAEETLSPAANGSASPSPASKVDIASKDRGAADRGPKNSEEGGGGGNLSRKSSRNVKASRPAPAAPRSSTPVSIPVEGVVRQIAVGAAHTLILTDKIHAFGSDAKGQLRGLDGLPADQVAASWNGSYVLHNGRIRAQGADTHGQLCGAADSGGEISLPTDAQVKRIVAGSEHLLVLLQDGTLLAGGWNEHGNLGLGDQRDRDGLVEVPNVNAARAWAGCATSFVV